MAHSEPLRWRGYGSLANVLGFDDNIDTPSSPSVVSPQMTAMTPPMWNSPYGGLSPSTIASPVTPMASFSLYSPNAFYSPLQDSSKPPAHLTDYPSPSFHPQSPILQSEYSLLIHTPPMYYAPEEARHCPLVSRPGPLVPQRAYTAPFSPGNKPMQIEFRTASGVLGVPMRLVRDAGGSGSPIQGANKTPFPDSIASTITLRIWWPGYTQWSRRCTLRKATTGLLTRSELATTVTEVFKEFIEEAREDPRDQGQSQWRVGRGHISVDDLVLLRVNQVSQGSWQADVRLETER